MRPHDRSKLEKIINGKSRHDAREYQRAQILLKLSEGLGVTEIAEELEISRDTVNARRDLYLTSGLERALSVAPGRGRKRKFSEAQEQQIVAVACSEPPEGASHWSYRLLVEEVQRRKIVKGISKTRIYVILERHELKPWREKNVVRHKSR